MGYRILVPWYRMGGADDELARSHFRGEMPKHLRREDQRVVVHRAQVFRRLLLELDVRVAVPRRDAAGVVRPRGVRGQETAAVRGTDLESRKTVERAFEYEMREADRRVERVSDRVGEPAVALEPLAQLGSALRVDEDEHPELLCFRPERVKFLFRELFAGNARADSRAAQAELLHTVLELL